MIESKSYNLQIKYPASKLDILNAIDNLTENINLNYISVNKKEKFYKNLSWITRFLSVIFLSIGLITPIFQSTFSNNFPLLQIAYASIVFSGLLILIDQVFVHTDSWIIYSKASQSIEIERNRVSLLKTSLDATLPSDEAAQERIQEILLSLGESIDKISAINSETQKIFNEKVISGRSALLKRVNDSSSEAKGAAAADAKLKQTEALNKARKEGANGAVRVEIGNPETLSACKILIGENSYDWAKERRSLVIEDLPIGLNKYVLQATLTNNASYITENIIDVKENSVQNIVINTPAS